MKRLIICADGTWNDEDRVSASTNVSKLHKPCSRNIRECYEFLIDHYEYGDEPHDFALPSFGLA